MFQQNVGLFKRDVYLDTYLLDGDGTGNLGSPHILHGPHGLLLYLHVQRVGGPARVGPVFLVPCLRGMVYIMLL